MTENKITQTERCGNEEHCISIHTFQDKKAILGINVGVVTFILHMGHGDLVCLGDAIQRIIDGEDGYSEQKDDHHSGQVS